MLVSFLASCEKKKKEGKQQQLLILLSGPEPQRTILENKILQQIKKFTGSALIVRGLPGNETQLQATNNVQCVNHLTAEQLQNDIENSSFIIARSGYSTVMDLLKMQKKVLLFFSILVPLTQQELILIMING